jgi:alpha-galactosidase
MAFPTAVPIVVPSCRHTVALTSQMRFHRAALCGPCYELPRILDNGNGMKTKRSNKMKNKRKISLTAMVGFLILGSFFQVSALDNGLAKTPPMGWNSWNIFAGNIDETKIKQIADTMVSSGMRDAGFIYLNLDDNWMATSRDGSGNLQSDPTRFPSGMKALGDYIHSKGLKFGIYGCRGTKTCMGVNQSGSYGNEQRDANTFASWGVDYLKYDNCNAVGAMQTDYQNMKNALASCGRPIVFSVCAWEFDSWMPATGNLWRISSDITDIWDNGTAYFHGIVNCIDLDASLASYASPGAWNDPDMLEIGNTGCTTEEYRTQMSMWSILAAPLIAGNDIRSMSQATKDILLNTEVIAIDQDSAGIQGTRISSSNGLEVWCKPLGSANGTTKAVALLNRNGSSANITVTFSSIGLSGAVTVRDLWAKTDMGTYSGSFTMTVPSHGAGVLKIASAASPTAVPTAAPTVGPTAGPQSAYAQIEAENYSLMSGIQTETCNEGGLDVGYIENGDYIAFNSIDFGSGAGSFQARAASAGSGGSIEIRLDGTAGTLVGTCAVAATGDWQTYATVTCNVSGSSGIHNLYLVFTGGTGYLFNVNWIRFVPASACTLKGDVNGSGSIDIVDALLVAQAYVGLNPSNYNSACADVNCSGTVDIVDALLIAQLYVGLISTFPC